MKLHVVSIIALLFSGVLIFSLPRRYIVAPILVSGILIPMGEGVVIAGFDFYGVRILILFGWMRLFFRSELDSLKLNKTDKAILLFVLICVVAYSILWQTLEAFVNRMGFAYTVLGIYFFFRFWVSDLDDIERIIKILLFISIILFFFALIELLTHKNLFSVFGGVPSITMIRDGKLRCQGPFGHPITFGNFGGFTLSLSFLLFWQWKQRWKLSLLGIIASLIIVVSSNSSGPIFTLIASVLGMAMWIFRKNMRLVRWGIFFALLGLHLVMKAPVWALIDRVGLLAGSSSYHRFLLVDQFIRRFSEWYLLGIKSTAHWGHHEALQLWDVSNHFVRTGVDGGFISFALFISIIVFSFSCIGRLMHLYENNLENQKLFWILGVGMFVYMAAFMGASIWDQTVLVWYLILAMISSCGNLIENRNINDRKEETI